jgi:folate-binding protein YgfZ
LYETAAWLDRSARGRLRLTGNDRRSYLQGILTNDVAALTRGTGCYSAMLTPQGRMIADMRVLELGDALLIDLPQSVAASVRDRLEQFIFTEDVAVQDVSTSIFQFGVYGPAASRAILAAFDGVRLPDEIVPDTSRLDSLELHGNILCDAGGSPTLVAKSDDYGQTGFEVFIENSAFSRFAHALQNAGAIHIDESTADVARIEAGRPAFGQDMDENTIPLEAGIEDRAISHTKGCYVGQEIIIRVLHRGHGRVARRLVGLLLDAMAERGDRLRSGDREVGLITSVAHSPALGRHIALGYVHRDFVEAGTPLTVTTGTGGDVAAAIATLPFVGP